MIKEKGKKKAMHLKRKPRMIYILDTHLFHDEYACVWTGVECVGGNKAALRLVQLMNQRRDL